MIDPITQLILEKEKALDTILEGYDLECQKCGRVIAIVKDGQGPLSCCNQRMFVMGSNPEDPAEDIEEVRKTLKGVKVEPDFMVALSDVNFSPYDQSDAQKRAEEKRKKKVSEDIESITDQKVVPRRYDKEYMDQRQQARHELIKRQKVARKQRQKDSRER